MNYSTAITTLTNEANYSGDANLQAAVTTLADSNSSQAAKSDALETCNDLFPTAQLQDVPNFGAALCFVALTVNPTAPYPTKGR